MDLIIVVGYRWIIIVYFSRNRVTRQLIVTLWSVTIAIVLEIDRKINNDYLYTLFIYNIHISITIS
jgi:hypothetical protein